MADAEKINENFQYVLENATGSVGCSAEQDGSSVVITCADGSAGVVAGYGTVATVLVGELGQAEVLGPYNTGDVVLIDGRGIEIGPYVSGRTFNSNDNIEWKTKFKLDGRDQELLILELPSEQRLSFKHSRGTTFGYANADCSDQGGSLYTNLTYDPTVEKWLKGTTEGGISGVLVRAYRSSPLLELDGTIRAASECQEAQIPDVDSLFPMVEVQMPEDIVNMQYPLSVEQLP